MPYTYEYPRPAVTVDAAVFRNHNGKSEILLIQRGNEPFKGMWAIPGGFIEMDEQLLDSAMRELEEETGITGVKLLQYGAYGDIGRDPRHRTISIAFAGLLNDNGMQAKADDDAADCRWFSIADLPDKIAFDHDLLISDAIAFAEEKGWIRLK